MHQSGHSRAHNMQFVQFSSSRAMTPRVRGGRYGFTSGYSTVWLGLASVLAVVASPLIRPGSMPLNQDALLGSSCECCCSVIVSSRPPILRSGPAEPARGGREPARPSAEADPHASAARTCLLYTS